MYFLIFSKKIILLKKLNLFNLKSLSLNKKKFEFQIKPEVHAKYEICLKAD